MVWQKGKELNNGKFIVVGEEPLGSGGFGITYKVARTRNDNQELFVIKTLNAIAQNRSNFRQLKDDFFNEAHTLAGFKHDNIVKIYPKGFTEPEDELWCMVMEFIEGQNLEEYLEKNKEITEIDAIALITKVGEALAYIHQSRYLHRDINPKNIMLRNCDLSSPVLIDFGLAREFDPNQSLTMDSRLTKHFAPLEQYDLDSLPSYIDVDRSQYKVRAWTDVYSLAATLYNLLTNQKPIEARFRHVSPKDFKSPQQLNPKISDRTNAAILKGMSLNPQDRSKTISEWLNLLSGNVLNNGLYRLQEPLNQNHMCKNDYDFSDEYNIVYQAIETKSQTPVIIKTLSQEAITSSLTSNLTLEKAIAYLKNEAKLTQEIRQYNIPNVVCFRDYFEEFGIPYLVLDFIEGENLFRLVERSGKLPEERAVKYIKQIASALLVCHKHKIYHRDINPDNIIIRSQDDQAILIDFDISSNSELTGNNFFKPPQLVNKRNFDIDLYSLAATLYYLVTGVNPSSGLHDLVINKWFDYDAEKQKQVLKNPRKLNPNLSEYINRAIVEGMRFESGDRFFSIEKWLKSVSIPVSKRKNRSSSSVRQHTVNIKPKSKKRFQYFSKEELLFILKVIVFSLLALFLWFFALKLSLTSIKFIFALLRLYQPKIFNHIGSFYNSYWGRKIFMTLVGFLLILISILINTLSNIVLTFLFYVLFATKKDKILYLSCGTTFTNQPYWAYLLVPASKYVPMKKAEIKGSLRLTDYGEIIMHEIGKNLPSENHKRLLGDKLKKHNSFSSPIAEYCGFTFLFIFNLIFRRKIQDAEILRIHIIPVSFLFILYFKYFGKLKCWYEKVLKMTTIVIK